MQRETALRWSWMNVLNTKRYEALKAHYKDLDTALESISLEMLQELGCREDTAMLAMNRLEEFDAAAYEAELKKRGIEFCSIEDDAYPDALSQIADPPIFLYWKGDVSVLSRPCLSLVGTREMSDYGRRVTGALVPEIVQAGVITVSGLAYGIDAEVAKETLRIGGKTVAVLGHGLAIIYPKANEKLGEEIVKKGGLILSEFPLDINPDRFTFPARNRIIAGLSLGTVVVEAAKGSGSLITAELALEYGKDVFAIPGPIFDQNFEGCHQLISRGHAKLVASASDILAELGVVAPGRAPGESSFSPESPEEDRIFSTLSSMPVTVDDLSVQTEIDIAVLNAVLTVLELKGAAKNVGSGTWVRA